MISNGVNTKYYANNKNQHFSQTFFWTDIENNLINKLNDFAEEFLEKCKVSKMISRYIVLHESDKILMVLRPYQFFAVEKIVERVKETEKGGYIWHTTGSGKTLTSFKASQILKDLPKVHKVIFVVDRNDLDYQTIKEFNHFVKGSVDATDNTKTLVKQLSDHSLKLTVTTIQKLNTAISKNKYLKHIQDLKAKKVVFIFDECHRSQFGDTHKRIKEFFTKAQIFGFTGTPILEENASKNHLGKRTTRDLFGEALHKYVITNAIKDENVLKFAVEYVGRYKEKKESRNYVDIEVEDIDTKELLESETRLSKIADYIIAHHNRKTYDKSFSAIFCVSNVPTLIKYYEIFKQKKEAGEHNLRVATIFSYIANEDDKDADGLSDEANFDYSKDTPINKHSRDMLEEFITDYNSTYSTNFTTKDSKSFYDYYKDIAKKIKEREKKTFKDKDRIDILLVVNMFLTGFDAKKLNTLYVDKNLKQHGLVQAFSRTNRILNSQKSHGNIVCFRNLKKKTDDAIKLFSNTEASEIILVKPYEDHLEQFLDTLEKFKVLTPTVESVDKLFTEDEEFEFVTLFRSLIRLKNNLKTYADFKHDDLKISAQEFEDYQGKYLDIRDKTKVKKEKVSILDDVDFELELIQRDEINVTYILKLLADLVGETDETERDKVIQRISNTIKSDTKLRSKKELIEEFINENLPKIKKVDDLEENFMNFWNNQKQKALEEICTEEDLIPENLEKVIESYYFSEKEPDRDQIIETFKHRKVKLKEKRPLIERIKEKIMNFISKFDDGF